MHQIRFQLGLRLRPCCGSLQHSPNPLAGLKGRTFKGREDRENERRQREGNAGGGREVRCPHSKFLDPPVVPWFYLNNKHPMGREVELA